MRNVFWAGLIGAMIGSVAGMYQKRTNPNRAAGVAALTAAATFVVVAAIFSLFF